MTNDSPMHKASVDLKHSILLKGHQGHHHSGIVHHRYLPYQTNGRYGEGEEGAHPQGLVHCVGGGGSDCVHATCTSNSL